MRLRVLLLAMVGSTLLPGIVKAEKLTASALAAKIDEHIAARWTQRKVTPAPRADDSELVRRLYLDLSGRIPDILAARDFIENPGKDKREKLIDKLLASERYTIHWANVWRSWWLPNSTDPNAYYLPMYFESWLRTQLKDNTGYDRMVRSMLADTAMNYNGPYSFLVANQSKPENLAAAASRMFLGVKLECAQCHNHPFAKWKKQQFWEFAAFFAEVVPQPVTPNGGVPTRRITAGEITIPGTTKKVKATFLDGKVATFSGSARPALADWVTKKDNPFFARAAVNRIWEYLLGTGLVEPVDEESKDNPPSHPALLDLLAKQFAENDFNLKYLIKAITMSRAYQLSSKQTNSAQADARLFARMKVRGLSPEQMYDSLVVATGQKEEELAGVNQYGQFVNLNPNSPRFDFLRRFPNQDKRTEQHTSILQALYLMNGKLVADATSLEHNKNLEIIAQAKTIKTSRRVQQLFLITLARKPSAAESSRLIKYVDEGGPHKDSARALCDVFWALLNSSEFCTNH